MMYFFKANRGCDGVIFFSPRTTFTKMENIFFGAVGQVLDEDGKTRAISYGNACLVVPPIAPFDIPIVEEVPMASKKNAMDLIRRKGLEVVGQSPSGDETGKISGILATSSVAWPSLFYAYVPTAPTIPLPFSRVNADGKQTEIRDIAAPLPLRTDNDPLTSYRAGRRLASLFSKYAEYFYAISKKAGVIRSVDEFGQLVTVDPAWEYDLDALGDRLVPPDHDALGSIMYSGDRLVVPSNSVKSALWQRLRVALLNNSSAVMATADEIFAGTKHVVLSDYKAGGNQLVFLGRDGLDRWRKGRRPFVPGDDKESNSGWICSPFLRPFSTEPYFFRHPRLHKGGLCLIQNLESTGKEDDDEDSAAWLCLRWSQDRINEGNVALSKYREGRNVSRRVYDSGLVSIDGLDKRKTKHIARIVRYSPGRFGSILFI